MTNQISSSPPTRSHLLPLLAQGMKLDVPLPYDAAFAALAPTIRENMPDQADALPLFMKWLELRQVDLTLQQAVHLWDKFFTLYIEDLPRMHRTWGHAGSNAPMAFPARSRMVLEIWLNKHYRPWEYRLSRKKGGKILLRAWWFVRGIVTLGASVLFFSYLFAMLEPDAKNH